MADQEEAVKIVIEVVDKFSKPLVDLRKDLGNLADKGGDGAVRTATSFTVLRESIHTVSRSVTSTLMPSLKVLGLGFAGVAGTLATFVAGLKNLGGGIAELTRLSTETRLGIDKMRELESVGRRVGISSEQMRSGFRGFAEEMDKLRMGVGGADGLQAFFSQHGIGWAGRELISIKDVNKQLDYALELVDRIDDPRQKRLVLERLQLPSNLAQVPRAERQRAIEEYRKAVGPLNKETKEASLRFAEAMLKLGTAWDVFTKRLAENGGLDAMSNLLEKMATNATSFADTISTIAAGLRFFFGGNAPKPGEASGGITRQSAPGGSKEETARLLKTSTSEGVVDAFKKMALDMGGGDGAGGNAFGGASVIRASLGGGGGGYPGRNKTADDSVPASVPPNIGGGKVGGNMGTMRGVDPRLVELATAGAEYLPEGYTLRPTSGVRTRTNNYSLHPSGKASDWQIYGPDGKPIPNRGDDRTGLYTLWARGAYTEALKRYGPEVANRMGWGGAFGTSPGSNVPDIMHLDFGGHRGRLRPGNILRNLGPLSKEKQDEVERKRTQPPPPRVRLHDNNDEPGRVEGAAKVRVDLNGFPRGTKTTATAGGVFSDVELHRGHMPQTESA
jgi:hypothetical protein